ncbi:hypothetical protein C7271_19690 [filamentous cyanobacterium CCP5]|nr:hypothetical protein C7271_19690 [filamentous cyanobacterium CCP5]
MKELLYRFNSCVRPASLMGPMVLIGAIIFLQVAPNAALAQSGGSRDEFPGRRQGGGTHVVLPVDGL